MRYKLLNETRINKHAKMFPDTTPTLGFSKKKSMSFHMHPNSVQYLTYFNFTKIC